jgi:hypothetical protein
MPQVPAEPKEGDSKEGLLASGNANFDGIKIDMNS